jgi:hypothetical protein
MDSSFFLGTLGIIYQGTDIQGVFEVEAFLLTCDSMRCSKEF